MRKNYKSILIIFSIILILIFCCGLVSATDNLNDNSQISIVDDASSVSISSVESSVDDVELSDSINEIETIDDSNSLSIDKPKSVSGILSDPISGNNSKDIEKTINSSNDGDTINITGNFSGGMDVRKNVTIIGIGETNLRGYMRLYGNSSIRNCIIKNPTIDSYDSSSFINCSFIYSGSHDISMHDKSSLINCSFFNYTPKYYSQVYIDSIFYPINMYRGSSMINCSFDYYHPNLISISEGVTVLNIIQDEYIPLTDLQKIIDQSENEVTLQKDYSFVHGENGGKIIINKTVKINGNGHVLSGGNYSSIFDITKSGSLTISNVTIKHSETAFSNKGILNISNSKIEENLNKNFYGPFYDGAFIYNAGEFYLKNCSFTNHKWTDSIIYSPDGHGEVVNCTFKNNEFEGGSNWDTCEKFDGTCIEGVNCSILNCSFINNRGAIRGENNTIKNCKFINNILSATYIVDLGNNSVISDSLFSNNSFKETMYGSIDNVELELYKGSSSICASFNTKIINCSFVNLSSECNSSAILGAGKNVSVVNCSFVDCSARDGGAIFWDDNFMGYDNVSIVNCSFVDCSANKGGAIFSTYGLLMWGTFLPSNMSVIDCSFVDCSAIEGGAICWHAVNGSIMGCSFVDCSADYGGALSLSNRGHIDYYCWDWNEPYSFMINLTVKECSFINNTANLDGGAINVFNSRIMSNKSSPLDGICYIEDSNFSGNIAKSRGQNIYNRGILSLSDNEISDDCATIYNDFYKKNSSIYSPLKIVVLDNSTKKANDDSTFKIYAKLIDDNENLIADEKIVFNLGSMDIPAFFNKNTGLFECDLDVNELSSYRTVVSAIYDGAKDLSVDTGVIITDVNIGLSYVNNLVIVKLVDSEGNPISGENLSLSINGVNKDLVTDANGNANVTIDSNSTVKATYTDECGVDVSSSLVVSIIEKYINVPVTANATLSLDLSDDGSLVIVSLKDLNGKAIASAKVLATVNGANKTLTTNASGQAKLSIKGNATVEVKYVDAKNSNATVSTKLTVTSNSEEVPIKKEGSVIDYKDMITTAVTKGSFREGEYFVVTLKDAKGKALANKPIKIGFNGVIYDRTTNENGSARLQINLVKVDLYTFAICFLGDDEYNASFVVAKITVNPQKAKLTASSNSYKASAKTKTIKATLKDAKGRAVSGRELTFTLNGKTYTAKTNSKGIASVNVSLSKKGTYKFNVKLDNDITFATATSSGRITIK